MSKLLNLARLDRKLKRLPTVAKSHIQSEMETVADTIVSMMKSLVPERTGALHDSIGWTWGKAPKGSFVISTVKASLGGDLTLTIFAGSDKAYWARWVEFGTQAGVVKQRVSDFGAGIKQHKSKGRQSYRTHPGTDARPFFYVSWRANKKSAVRAVRKATRASARKVAAGS